MTWPGWVDWPRIAAGWQGAESAPGQGQRQWSVVMVQGMITETYTCYGGCRVTCDRVRGAFRTSCGTVSGSTLRPGGPGQHQGDPGCWSRPSLTASWPSLLLLVTGFNSIVALPDVVLTATGRATLLSNRTADSNREGHDAHAAPAAPGQARRTSAQKLRSRAEALFQKISRGKPSADPPGAWLLHAPESPAAPMTWANFRDHARGHDHGRAFLSEPRAPGSSGKPPRRPARRPASPDPATYSPI